jgi:hypothetical protein
MEAMEPLLFFNLAHISCFDISFLSCGGGTRGAREVRYEEAKPGLRT